MTRSQDELALEILRRLDADGDLARNSERLGALADSVTGRTLLRVLGLDPQHVHRLRTQQSELLRQAARYVLRFSPRGWAPSGLVPADVTARALAVLDASGSFDEADRVLIEGWNEPVRLNFSWSRIIGLGLKDPLRQEALLARANLVEKALAHHRAGAYEASVPIVLAQVDGLVIDATNGKSGFFWRADPRALVDDATLAGLPEGLEVLRGLFSISQNSTARTGSRSRHGIMHGRELGYDTNLNSTQCFVLLLAVIELVTPVFEAAGDGAKDATP